MSTRNPFLALPAEELVPNGRQSLRTRLHRLARTTLMQAAAGCALAVAAAGLSTASAAPAPISKANPLKVVITSLPPYVTLGKDGHLEGIDGKLFDKAAKQLGYKYTVTVTNWDGMLAAVQSGRADLAVSDVAWTPARAGTGLFTDPSYYLPELISVAKDVHISTVEQLVGHKVGAINGQSYVDPLNNVKGVTLRLYPDTVALLSDISAGRIDAAFMDPLVMVYQKKVRPDLHFNVVPLTPPTMAQVEQHPKWALFGPQMIGWYVRPGGESLVDQLNGVIHESWKNGTNAAMIKAQGVTDVAPFLNPGPEWLASYAKQRIGVDRKAGWKAPSAGPVAK
ncbi:hypothetical protein CDEF62S_05574 [Castellaniella defragrans]